MRPCVPAVGREQPQAAAGSVSAAPVLALCVDAASVLPPPGALALFGVFPGMRCAGYISCADSRVGACDDELRVLICHRFSIPVQVHLKLHRSQVRCRGVQMVLGHAQCQMAFYVQQRAFELPRPRANQSAPNPDRPANVRYSELFNHMPCPPYTPVRAGARPLRHSHVGVTASATMIICRQQLWRLKRSRIDTADGL